jgi:hypothetical protein
MDRIKYFQNGASILFEIRYTVKGTIAAPTYSDTDF